LLGLSYPLLLLFDNFMISLKSLIHQVIFDKLAAV
jgi:hypothetical protein